jgi:pimeloyl-ACP methyl ester carboxylesterase
VRKKKDISMEEKRWVTQDGIQIASNYYRGVSLTPSQKRGRKSLNSTLLILAPGFSKYKDAFPMSDLAKELTRWGDVLCLDFRGTGKSGGRYQFGGSEYLDLEPMLRWGRFHYGQIVLVGLSLGSYHSLRAAHAWPSLVDKLLLVSCPTRLEDVLLTLGPLRQSFAIATDWKALRKRLTSEFDIFFRWGNPFSAKPDASKLASGLRTPSDFLVGEKDRLVVKSLSRRIFEKVTSKTSWTEIPGGNHGEFLYLEQPREFRQWCEKVLA